MNFTFAETYTWDERPLGYPSLHMFWGSASPYLTRGLWTGATLDDARAISAEIAIGFYSKWLVEISDFKVEHKL